MADILKIKGADGQWHTITAVKGDKGDQGPKGDTYTLTAEDKSAIATLVYNQLVDAEGEKF